MDMKINIDTWSEILPLVLIKKNVCEHITIYDVHDTPLFMTRDEVVAYINSSRTSHDDDELDENEMNESTGDLLYSHLYDNHIYSIFVVKIEDGSVHIKENLGDNDYDRLDEILDVLISIVHENDRPAVTATLKSSIDVITKPPFIN